MEQTSVIGVSESEKLIYQEIWYNPLSIIIFTKESDYWHYVAISRQTGKVSSGDKTNSAKQELVDLYEMVQIDLSLKEKKT